MPPKVNKQQRSPLLHASSPIQTLTVGPGVTPGLRLAPLADYTAGGDLHPALKTSIQLFSSASVYDRFFKNASGNFGQRAFTKKNKCSII